MAVYFFDSSALVKRHVTETGNAWVRSLTRVKAAHTLYIASITAVEITSAITRRQRGGHLSAAQGGAVLGHFRRHLTQRYKDGLPDTHQLAKGWPENYVWNPFAIKTLLERAGLRMGAPSAGPCLSEAWVWITFVGVWNSLSITSVTGRAESEAYAERCSQHDQG